MVKVAQHSWLGGQLDYEMMGRQDIAKYRKGATTIRNFLPVRRGALRKRPGTDFLLDVSDYVGFTDGKPNKFRMFPFSYLEDVGFVILMCAGKARAVSDAGAAYDITGTIPYTAAEIDEISYVQCGDILYLAHRNHPPAEIRHTDATMFAYAVCGLNSTDLPTPTIFNAQISRNKLAYDYRGGTVTDLYAASLVVEKDGAEYEGPLYEMEAHWDAGASSGNDQKLGSADSEPMTYLKPQTSSDAYNHIVKFYGTTYYLPFTESQRINISIRFISRNYKVKQVRLYKNNGGTYGLIAVKRKTYAKSSDARTATLEDSGVVPDTSISPMDDKTVFGSAGNYPGCVALYQQRLVWASSANDPARIWMSMTGDFYEHRPHVIQRTDDPIDFILPITQFAEINHIIELGRLFAFTASSELLVGSNSDASGVTYETIQATTQSHVGCKKRLPPIIANNSILFAERTGQIVRDFSFDIAKNLYGGADVSIFASSIFNERSIVDWTWQHQPNSTAWAVLSDGTVAALCYMTDQEVCAWSTHELGGGGRALAIAKTCGIRGTDSDNPTTSTVLVAVLRGDAITLERMRPWPKQSSDTIANMVTMDAVRSLEPGDAIPDGMTAVDKATGATVTTVGESGAWAGYAFAAEMTSIYPAISDEDIGAGQFDVKVVQQVALRVINSVGGTVRACDVAAESASDLRAFNPDLALKVSDGAVLTPVTDVRCVLAGSNNRDGRVTLMQDEPWPFELLSMETDLAVEVEGQQR